MGCASSVTIPPQNDKEGKSGSGKGSGKAGKEAGQGKGSANGTGKKEESGLPKGLDRYELGEELGRGHFATVRLCRDKVSGNQYAVKIIDKRDFAKDEETVMAEIKILQQVGRHQHIVSLLDTFEDPKDFYLVMEYCSGGDLFSKIVDEGKYNEQRAQRVCAQLAQALLYIHQRGVTHRDLKPENILLTENSIDADIKVADFGLSKLIENDNAVMKTVCGTWAYCAPEVIAHSPYTSAVDVWTLGVLMFILLSGYHPFDVYGDMPEPKLLKKILSCNYDFDDEVWDYVSTEAKELITKLLVLDADKRMTLDAYLQSSWIKETITHENELPNVVNRLAKFSASKQLTGLIMAKVASKRWKRATKEHKKNKQGKFDRPDGHPLNNNPKDMQNVLYDPSMEIPDDSSSKRTKGGIGSQPR